MTLATVDRDVSRPDIVLVGAEEAHALATEFLLDHVGNQLTADQPLRMHSAVRSTWIVPVQLVYVHSGPLGNVGVVAIDEETGQVVGWTPIAQMKEASRQLREADEPALTEMLSVPSLSIQTK